MSTTVCHRDNDGKLTNCITFGRGGPVFHPSGRQQEIGIYPELFTDASVVNTIHLAAESIADDGVRAALQNGIRAAYDALQKRAGEKMSVKLDDHAAGQSA
jgi:hypothetical protein